MKKIIVMILMMTSFLLFAEETFTVSGYVVTESECPVYIFLVDEKNFKTPMTGLKKLMALPDKNGKIFYSFHSMKKGIYGIRCFQDKNKNGYLDRGAFGPSEPWGMSFKNSEKSGWPSFKMISFTLNENVTLKTITLK